jgi:transposase
MFALSPATRVYLAAGPTDLRQGFNGLVALAQNVLEADPLSGHLFIFCNRTRTRVKVLWCDGSGLWCATKRLEQGRFSWPALESGAQRVSVRGEELTLLLGGIELEKTRSKDWWRREREES